MIKWSHGFNFFWIFETHRGICVLMLFLFIWCCSEGESFLHEILICWRLFCSFDDAAKECLSCTEPGMSWEDVSCTLFPTGLHGDRGEDFSDSYPFSRAGMLGWEEIFEPLSQSPEQACIMGIRSFISCSFPRAGMHAWEKVLLTPIVSPGQACWNGRILWGQQLKISYWPKAGA